MTDQPNRTSPLPPASVLAAFGVRGDPVPLPGGQGRSVRVDGYVFKPAGPDEDESEWAASLLESLSPGEGFRVPPPLRTAQGHSVVDGWTAARFLPGEPGPQGHWAGVLDAGRAFHAALRGAPRPAFLDRRTHPWAVADRVAWGEQDVEVIEELAAPFATLLRLRRPVPQDGAQLVHGDLTGNVLFAPGEPPVVIDFSPYWRPPLFAEAVVVVDGLLWFDPPPGLLTSASGHPHWRQMLIRALIFRLVAYSGIAGPSVKDRARERERYVRATRAVVDRLRPGTSG
ncbi:aminoglycoside phosphotransferase [Streptomyces sp. NPDC049954]|uniref:aminoglycoside phosphotransferase n=1 Tax=Streptomyces sp. NPDC049954 TaxID=3155779 RepID=UPI0034251A9B